MGLQRDPRSFDGACQDVVELVTDYLDGALPAGVVPAFEAHLDECDDCRELIAQFRATIAEVGDVRLPSLPDAVRYRLVEAFSSLLGDRLA